VAVVMPLTTTGGGAVRRRPVAKLAPAVSSPAADGAAGQEAQEWSAPLATTVAVEMQ